MDAKMKVRQLQIGDVYNTKRDNTLRVLVRFSATKDVCASVCVYSRSIRVQYTDDEVLYVRPSLIEDVSSHLTFFQKIKSLFNN